MSDRIAVMNKGHYEQLGDPEVLYERPKTRFVAGFLGVSNLLSVQPDGTSGDMAAFKLGDGTACRVPAALAAGHKGRIALGVRPEKIRLTEPGREIPAGYNRLSGTIAHASYLGVSTQYIVRLADGHRVTVFEQNVERASKSELWATGESVALSWQPDHSFIVEDAGAVDDADALGTDALQPVAAA